MPVLNFENVTYYYEAAGRKVPILENVDAAFESGTLYTIVGPSGSGKTTALSLLGALEAPKTGRVLFRGKDIAEIGYTKYRSKNIGIVFQAYNLLEYLNPLQNVTAAMEISQNKLPEKEKRARTLLSRMGLTRTQMRRSIRKLSGGEQQRVAIARALGTDADIILADEPTGNLDADTAAEIIELFRDLAHKDGKCVIAVTHSQDFARQADVVLHLRGRKLTAG